MIFERILADFYAPPLGLLYAARMHNKKPHRLPGGTGKRWGRATQMGYGLTTYGYYTIRVKA